MRRTITLGLLLALPAQSGAARPAVAAYADDGKAFDRADLSWVLAIGGVVAAAAGGAMLVFGYGEQLRLERALVPYADQARTERTARAWSAGGGAALGLGVTLLASGVLLRVFDEDGHLLAGASPSPDGATVTVGLRF